MIAPLAIMLLFMPAGPSSVASSISRKPATTNTFIILSFQQIQLEWSNSGTLDNSILWDTTYGPKLALIVGVSSKTSAAPAASAILEALNLSLE